MKALSRAAALAVALIVPLTTTAGAADGRRTSVTSLGPLPPIPVVAELAPRALRDLDRLMAGGLAWFEQVDGVRCPGGPEELERASSGPRAYDEAQQVLESLGLGDYFSATHASMVMLSGECPKGGLLSGPVEFVFMIVKRQGSDGVGSEIKNSQHITGFFLEGNPVGEVTAATATATKTYRVLSSGEVIETKTDFGDPYWQRLSEQVNYSVAYSTYDRDGLLVGPVVTVSQSDMDPATSIGIASPVDAHRLVVETYTDGIFTMCRRMKDGALHGWTDQAPPLPRVCYQNGRIMKADICPDT